MWTMRLFFSLYNPLTLSKSLCLSPYMSLCFSLPSCPVSHKVCLSHHLCLYASLYLYTLSLIQSVCLTIYVSILLSTYIPCLSYSLSVSPSMSLFFSLPLYPVSHTVCLSHPLCLCASLYFYTFYTLSLIQTVCLTIYVSVLLSTFIPFIPCLSYSLSVSPSMSLCFFLSLYPVSNTDCLSHPLCLCASFYLYTLSLIQTVSLTLYVSVLLSVFIPCL